MALLTRLRGLGRSSGLVTLGALLAGCALLGVFSGERPFAFDHAVHAKEGLECGDCHVSWETEEDPGIPPRSACMLCHEAIDAEKPPERRIETLFEGDVLRAAHTSRLADEVIFSHKQHATKPIECVECHGDIATSDGPEDYRALRMSDCVDCHRQQSVQNECATCHQRLRTDVAPDTHLFQWTRLHGRSVRAQGTATADDCSMCHTQSSCRDCHQAMPPDNHDNYFRQRGHGVFARMDRQNCAACHRSDSCDACHRDTRPLNHRGSFGGTTSTHCLVCHFPVQGNECGTCHKSTPSHAQATPLPPGHNLAMNCRLCHGNGQALPHVDKGDECILCHR